MALNLWRAGALTALGMALAACVHGGVSTRGLPPQTMVAKGGSTVMTSGNIDGVPFVLVTSVRLFPQDNVVGLCAGTRVLAARDVSAHIREALAHDKSVLTLRRADGQSMTVQPAFVAVTYQAVPATADGSITVVPKDVGDAPGGCVATDLGWQGQWEGAVSGNLALYAALTRKRAQTVVGATP